MDVYADHAATSPLRPEARAAVLRALEEGVGNPSSLHAGGRRARRLLEEARERCAAVLGAGVDEVVFTSGATEADNLAVLGTMRLASPGDRVVVSAFEHPAVREAARTLKGEGFDLQVLPVDPSGQVDPAELEGLLTSRTRLVSVMGVNNEVGVEQPVSDLAGRCRKRGISFHCDAVQAAPWQDLRPLVAGVELLALSGHKVGGPPGAGLLYVRRGRTLAPLVRGGSQEAGRRPGTENVPAWLGLAAALEAAAGEAAVEAARLRDLKARLEEGLDRIPGASLLGAGARRAPHISAWTFAGVPADSLVAALDLAGIAVSAGSACASRGVGPSQVLLAMGRSASEARGLVRFSLGWSTTGACLDRLLDAVPRVLAELRARRSDEV